MIRHDDAQAGDWLTGALLSDRHGAVVAIHPYRCSRQCIRCGGGQCPDRQGWRYLTFQDGTQVTLTPGGVWPGDDQRRATTATTVGGVL